MKPEIAKFEITNGDTRKFDHEDRLAGTLVDYSDKPLTLDLLCVEPASMRKTFSNADGSIVFGNGKGLNFVAGGATPWYVARLTLKTGTLALPAPSRWKGQWRLIDALMNPVTDECIELEVKASI